MTELSKRGQILVQCVISIEMRVLKASPSAAAPSPRSTSLSFRITLSVTTKPDGASEMQLTAASAHIIQQAPE
jgi:hypothetical protein